MPSPSLPSVSSVRSVYNRAYAEPGLMGTHLDAEYSQVTKETLLGFCRDAPGDDLLDLGTGDGDLGAFIESRWRWHGVDVSDQGVSRAKARFPGLFGLVGTAEHLPFRDSQFAAVVAADTLEHTFDLAASLAEVWRVLEPAGVLAFSVPTPNSLRRWGYNRLLRDRPSLPLIWNLIRVVSRRVQLFGRPDFQPIDRDLGVDTWRELVTAAGFRETAFTAWPSAPYLPIVYLLSAVKDQRR